MKFSIGDRVLLRRTGEEGFIVAFLSKQMVEVSIDDISFPVYADELEHPYLKWFTEPKATKSARKGEKIIPVEKAAAKPVRLSRGIYLSFLPQFASGTTDDIIEAFRIHFLNETADHLNFTYHARQSGGDTILQLNGTLHPFGNIFLHTLALEALNAQPRFHWHIAPKDKPEKGLSETLRIRPAQLIRHISAILESGEPSFSILLANDAEAVSGPAMTLPTPEILPQKSGKPNIQRHTDEERVLDLHLKASEDDNPAQMLAQQISLLQQKLNAAYAAGMESMVVIHGIGNGTLRNAVHNELRETPFVQRFVNEWMGAYGWGATEVFFGERALEMRL